MKSARDPDPFMETKTTPSRRTLRGLDWLNFLLADVQTGVGPFVAIYLAGYNRTKRASGSRSRSAGSQEFSRRLRRARSLTSSDRSERWSVWPWPRWLRERC